ncbi:MAG: ATP-binding protein [Verrucomicrobiales bacterium]|jgi:predicted AAA+ superfamily ATPase|nr:ATP-binding protein [Verrucomicrobiales bacterium]
MPKQYPRWQSRNVTAALQTRRVVVIAGARQTGKTTLSRQISQPDSVYRTLDDTGLLAAAQADPQGFVKNPSGTMIIDEIQKVPLLLPEIKRAVDLGNRPGQYLLTGSANLQTLPGVSESLAGRVKNIRLRPLTVGEIGGGAPDFLSRAFAADFPVKITGYDKETVIDLAFRGGYPEAVRLKDRRDRREWHRDYADSLLARDLRDIANIRRQDVLRELTVALTAWSGKFLDLKSVCAPLAISKLTVESYLNALLSLYLFDKVAPWTRSDYERIGRRAKFFTADTGLMSSLLGWEAREVLLNADRSGKLVETLVFQELAAQIDLDSRHGLFQYRDREKREIDFIVEREDGVLLGVEVKAGQHVATDDFKHLHWFAEHLAGKKSFTGMVLYTGEDTLSFGKKMLAVPVAALWHP